MFLKRHSTACSILPVSYKYSDCGRVCSAHPPRVRCVTDVQIFIFSLIPHDLDVLQRKDQTAREPFRLPPDHHLFSRLTELLITGNIYRQLL